MHAVPPQAEAALCESQQDCERLRFDAGEAKRNRRALIEEERRGAEAKDNAERKRRAKQVPWTLKETSGASEGSCGHQINHRAI